MADAETVPEAFEKVKEKNETIEGRPIGIQRLDDEFTIFFKKEDAEDTVLLITSVDEAEKLYNQLAGVFGDG